MLGLPQDGGEESPQGPSHGLHRRLFEVYRLPLAAFDSGADLGGGTAFFRLLVAEDGLFHAGGAGGTVGCLKAGVEAVVGLHSNTGILSPCPISLQKEAYAHCAIPPTEITNRTFRPIVPKTRRSTQSKTSTPTRRMTLNSVKVGPVAFLVPRSSCDT